ncbi:Glutamate--tRNA ligase 1 [Baekduia alba]|uniref:tRNA glutamyl-Q(34) synthetase GluQRS n=1 Tax=Baekduia alba TaxID=2997333 RepID=UPI00234075DB|nr:tRNA glutamyl-Q(34) synthetase GluQRS [Baekduia alba]WCB94543.1 Glutamate--tRNA ligase 1 [Baekduia alba]
MRAGATGRFAPSPTGTLHLGNLRTALLAWLYARAQGAPFLLRIEDLDRGRVRERYEVEQLADLAAIGLDWDGAIVRQSARTDHYAEALATLDAAAATYPCWCTRAEIREASSAPHGPLPEGHYPGTCRRLTAAQRADREASGRPPAIRVAAGAAAIAFRDRLHGEQHGVVDDFVVRRNDGAYAYNLAVVVDDGAQDVGEVVRGDDLLDSTPRQLWLADRLGLGGRDGMSFAHVPLVLGGDGARLAKRHGAVTLADRAEQGESAGEVRARLAASVGLAAPDERPSPAELVARFDPERFAPPPSGPLPGL